MSAKRDTDHQVARFVFLLSGFAIWYLSLAVSGYVLTGLIWESTAGARIFRLMTVAAGVTAQLCLGIAFSRVLSRIWPLSLDKTARLTESIIVLAVLALYCAGLVAAWKYLTRGASPLSPLHSPALILVAALLSAVWVITVAATFLRHALHPTLVLSSPFTLFLRRFSTISDRSVAHAVMSANVSARCIVLLVPRRTEPEDWNPATVFMAGVRPWAPLRSLPYFLQARDENWVDAVSKLMERAKIIVIDGSDVSDAVAVEVGLIDELRAWSKTILLLDRKRQKGYPVPTEHTPLAAISYDCTWKAALPRLLLGAILVIPAGIPITVPFVLFMRWLDAKLDPDTVIIELVAALVALFVLGSLYKVLFARPEMDGDSKQRLSDALTGSG
jgi:hypothetical protein